MTEEEKELEDEEAAEDMWEEMMKEQVYFDLIMAPKIGVKNEENN